MRGLDAGDPSTGLPEPRDFAVLDDVDAERVRAARIAPRDRVVPRDARAALIHAAARRKAHLIVRADQGHELAHGGRVQIFAVDPVDVERVRPAAEHLFVVTAIADREQPARAEHDVEVEFFRQRLVEAQRKVVDVGALAEEVVGADDGRVPSRIAAADPAAFDHRDVPHPVLFGEVIGGRETMPAAADDHDIVGRLGLRAAPCLRPVVVAAKRVLRERQGRIAHAD